MYIYIYIIYHLYDASQKEMGIELGSAAGKVLGRRILEALTTAYGAALSGHESSYCKLRGLFLYVYSDIHTYIQC